MPVVTSGYQLPVIFGLTTWAVLRSGP